MYEFPSALYTTKTACSFFSTGMELKCAYSFCTKTFRTEKGRNAHYRSTDGRLHNRSDVTHSRKRRLSENNSVSSSHDPKSRRLSTVPMSGDEVSTGLKSDTERVDDDLDFLADDTLILDVTSEDSEYSNASATRIFVED